MVKYSQTTERLALGFGVVGVVTVRMAATEASQGQRPRRAG